MGLYDAYYNCRLEPFSLSPDPRFLYLAPSHREAISQLLYAVESRKGFAVLTGEVGLGKTTLLRSLLEKMPEGVRAGYIFNPPRSIAELYAAIAGELGISFSDSSVPPGMQLNRFLLDTFRTGGTVVMIFDEAQGLSPEVLEEIRLLTNLETSTTKLFQVILAGQPEFDAMLDSVELRALRQRVVLRHRLNPLGLDDTIQYITSRVRIAGAERSPFALDACQAVHHYARGVPRVINLICDNALLTGYASDSPTVDQRQVEMVARDLGLEEPVAQLKQPSKGRAREAYERVISGARRRTRALKAAGVAVIVIAVALASAVALARTYSSRRELVRKVEVLVGGICSSTRQPGGALKVA